MLSHELRNPLAPILTGVYLLREVMATDNQVASEARDMIERQAMHLKRMVDDLLDVSRMALNRIELRGRRWTWRRSPAGRSESVRPILDERRHELTVSADPEPIAMSADPVRLEQAIAALLSNAAKFTDPGGRIAMTIGREGDQAVVRVRDSGIGLSPEMLVRAFEMFAQGDQGLARSARRTGHRVDPRPQPGPAARGHRRGRQRRARPGLRVHRQAPHHPGLPRRDARGVAHGRHRRGTAPAPALRTARIPSPARPEHPRPVAVLRVLLVDDNRDAARSTELLLRQAGHEVLVAHDGPAALDLAFKEHPDLVILDVGLPYIDGYGVAREIRRRSSIPLVALTGYAPEESTSLLFDAYLVKPVEPRRTRAAHRRFHQSEPRP